MDVRAVRDELVEELDEEDPADSLRDMVDAASPSSLGDDRRCRLRGDVRLKNDRKSPFGADGFVGVLCVREARPASLSSASAGVVGGVDTAPALRASPPSLASPVPDIIGDENVSATAAVHSSFVSDSSRDFLRGGDDPYVEEEEVDVRQVEVGLRAEDEEM